MNPEVKTAELVAPPSAPVKMVAKIKAIHPLRLSDGTSVAPGTVVECSEADAKEFADTQISTQYRFSGEMNGHQKLPKMTRAVRV